MISALIIDDEQHCIDQLTGLLQTYCTGKVVLLGTFNNIADGAAAIAALKPELVFLDVQLGDDTGFDMLKRLPKVDFEVVFTTAFEKYAVQAFKFSAIDYLLKPIDPDDLTAAIVKLDLLMGQKQIDKRLDTLFQNLKSNGQVRRITIPSGNDLLFVDTDQIIRCQADVNYTTIYLKDKRSITVAKTLKDFEDMLDDHGFFRIHNSHLVNLSCVSSYQKGKGGAVVMSDKSSLEVSVRRKELFLKKMAEL